MEGSDRYQRPHQVRPCPPNFAEVFIREGWRGVEVAFGARTSVNKRWIREAGGDELKARRLEYRRSQRKPDAPTPAPMPPPVQPISIVVRRAIDFLRSPAGGAWPITATGHGDFFFGSSRLTGGELVEKAARKGWEG